MKLLIDYSSFNLFNNRNQLLTATKLRLKNIKPDQQFLLKHLSLSQIQSIFTIIKQNLPPSSLVVPQITLQGTILSKEEITPLFRKIFHVLPLIQSTDNQLRITTPNLPLPAPVMGCIFSYLDKSKREELIATDNTFQTAAITNEMNKQEREASIIRTSVEEYLTRIAQIKQKNEKEEVPELTIPAAIAEPTKVFMLDLSNIKILTPNLFERLTTLYPNVQILNLQNTNVSHEFLKNFLKWPQIVSLNLNGCKNFEILFYQNWESFRDLKFLDIRNIGTKDSNGGYDVVSPLVYNNNAKVLISGEGYRGILGLASKYNVRPQALKAIMASGSYSAGDVRYLFTANRALLKQLVIQPNFDINMNMYEGQFFMEREESPGTLLHAICGHGDADMFEHVMSHSSTTIDVNKNFPADRSTPLDLLYQAKGYFSRNNNVALLTKIDQMENQLRKLGAKTWKELQASDSTLEQS